MACLSSSLCVVYWWRVYHCVTDEVILYNYGQMFFAPKKNKYIQFMCSAFCYYYCIQPVFVSGCHVAVTISGVCLCAECPVAMTTSSVFVSGCRVAMTTSSMCLCQGVVSL